MESNSNAVYGGFFIVPILALIALVISLNHGDVSLIWLLYLICGWLLWTLMEYIIHRLGFHVWYKRDHARHHELHHRNPHVNYGVSLMFWDRLFRTMKNPN